MRGVIFDLDGTLIDSAASILTSLNAALDSLGLRSRHLLTPEIIGPPLDQALALILDEQDAHRMRDVRLSFMAHYDEYGYKETRVYDEIDRLLRYLSTASIKLFIATNKRMLPTRLIVNHLGWGSYFQEIYTLDRYSPVLTTKSALLAKVVGELRHNIYDLVYVGDRSEDEEAATANELSFIRASWGYGSWRAKPERSKIVNTPLDLIQLLG